MSRKLICGLVILVAGALPQSALAKRAHHHAKRCHGHHHHCVKHSTVRSTSASDPTTQLADPTTQLPTSPAGNPAQSCRAERDDDDFAESHDGEDFEHFYGTNINRRNAFGKCVSAHAHQRGDDDDNGDDGDDGDDGGGVDDGSGGHSEN